MTIRILLIIVGIALLVLRVPWQLVIVADLAVYLRWAYTHPYRPHLRCKGTGRNAMSSRGRRGKCKGCGASGTKLAWDYRILRGIFRGASATRKQLKK